MARVMIIAITVVKSITIHMQIYSYVSKLEYASEVTEIRVKHE